ncbi:MAG: glycosyltransferase family 4 protein [Pirellula sp.]
MPNVTFFNRSYWPDSQATGQLLTELAEFLTAKNHSVRVVVGLPNFTHIKDAGNVEEDAVRNGVAIHRLAHSQRPIHKKVGRLQNLITFTLAVRKWLKQDRQSGSATGDVWVCETDPFFLPLVVGPAARRRGVKLVYYLQDIYPDVVVALDVASESLITRTLRNRLKREYQRADKIIVLDEDMKARLVGWGLSPAKIAIVPNWMDCELVRPSKVQNPLRQDWGVSDDEVLVMHSGNMGMTQRLEVLVDSFASPDIPEDTRLLLVGNGSKKPFLESHAAGLANVSFHDYQPKERLGESLSAADVHVVSMDARIIGCLAPSKLYGILASATPLLAIVPKNNAVWQFVIENELGWCVEPGDVAGVIKAIQHAKQLGRDKLREMGARGRAIALDRFDRTICCTQFEQAAGLNS